MAIKRHGKGRGSNPGPAFRPPHREMPEYALQCAMAYPGIRLWVTPKKWNAVDSEPLNLHLCKKLTRATYRLITNACYAEHYPLLCLRSRTTPCASETPENCFRINAPIETGK